MNPELSIIIPFSEKRIENLKQTIRFLLKDEITKKSELILVCQTYFEKINTSGFISIEHINLESDVYCRSKMCNLGVEKSKAKKIALLDSDRVLPKEYFSHVCSTINLNQCITTKNLWQISHPVSDLDIENEKYDAFPDQRSLKNEMHKKGSFSGNTVLFKNLYVSVGGMDESFLGYGYQDIDFSRTMINNGVEMVFLEEKEIHLYHTKNFTEAKKSTIENGIKYCEKWNLKPEKLLIEKGNSVGIDVMKILKQKKIKIL